MNDTIATIVGIILVLGLISYALLGQVAGIKDTGDKAAIEQSKIGEIIKASDMVTGSTVRNYARTAKEVVSVFPTSTDAAYDVKNLYVKITNKTEDGSEDIVSSKEDAKTMVNDSAVYKMEKIYNPDGDLHKITFTQQDLGTGGVK